MDDGDDKGEVDNEEDVPRARPTMAPQRLLMAKHKAKASRQKILRPRPPAFPPPLHLQRRSTKREVDNEEAKRKAKRYTSSEGEVDNEE